MANSKHVVYKSDGPHMEGAVKVSVGIGPGGSSSQTASPVGSGTSPETAGPGGNVPGQSPMEGAVQGSIPVVNQVNVVMNPDGTIGTNVEVADSTPVTGPEASRNGSSAANGGISAVGVQTGWVQVGNGYKYYKEDGSGYKTGWHFENNVDGTKSWYYLDEDLSNKEWMAIGWKKITGEKGEYWYYFRIDGKMSVYWELIDGMWYYLEPCNDGGNMIMKWKEINGRWYYFIPEEDAGYMMISWHEIDGNCYYFYNSEDERGIMATNHCRTAN